MVHALYSTFFLDNKFFFLQVIELQKAQDCLLPMGITSENVAHRYGVTRQEQDQAAVSSSEHALCFISIALPYTEM
jgi:acetyl-CoA acetyltransferase